MDKLDSLYLSKEEKIDDSQKKDRTSEEANSPLFETVKADRNDVKLDFSKDLSEEYIRNWIEGKSDEEVNSAIIEALEKADRENDIELDYLTAMSLISEIEKNKVYRAYRGDADFLKLVLGNSTYKKMAMTGYLSAGFYASEENNTIVDTYALTQRFTKWRKLLNL